MSLNRAPCLAAFLDHLGYIQIQVVLSRQTQFALFVNVVSAHI